MNRDKEIWLAVTSILETTLPECEVSRTYDILERLSELEENSVTPKIWVCLDGKDTEPLTKCQVKETYHFELFLAKYIASAEEPGIMAEMDAMLPLVQKIQDRFYFKTESVSITEETPAVEETSGQAEEPEEEESTEEEPPVQEEPFVSIDLKLMSADPDSGELYDLDFFTDSESFLCAMGISVMTVRDVDLGGTGE